MTYKFVRIKPGFTVYRFLLLLIGLALFYLVNQYIGLTVLFTAGIFSLTTVGKEIDPKKRRMRDFTALGNLSTGKWINLPKIEYIAVVRMIKGKKSFHASSATIVQVPSNEYIYQINFVIDPQKQNVIKVFSNESISTLNQAIELGKMMNLKILDFTTPQHKWID